MPAPTRDQWRELLPVIPLWHALTLPQRQAALALPHAYQPPAHAFRNLSATLDAALFETDAQGRKRPAGALRGLMSLNLRAAEWSRRDGIDIPRYVQLTTTHAQRHAMTGVRIGSNPIIAAAAFGKRLKAGGFSRALAESDSPQAFLRAVGGWMPEGIDYGAAQHKALRDWLLQATRKGDAFYLLDQEAFVVAGGACAPGDLLYLAVSYGIALFARMPDTLLPSLGAVAPGKPIDQVPENVERKTRPPLEPFARPFILDDMETWLRALKADPAPVLSDGRNVPVAHQRKVAKAFPDLPAFLPRAGFTPEERSAAALHLIFRLELAEAVGKRRKDWRLGIGKTGEAWLGLPRRDKWAAVLDRAPMGARRPWKNHETLEFLGGHDANPLPYLAATDTLFAWLAAAFSSLKTPSDWETFLRSASERANPFLADADRNAELSGRWAAWETPPEEAYRALLGRYAGRLASLGALSFAAAAKGTLSVTLSPPGKWLYGKAETRTLEEPARAAAVVGADFTVSLLAPDPEARMELAGFAEAEGPGFRLTRRSIQAGIRKGMDADAVLRTLEALSKHALPANIVHEIRAWAQSRKTVSLREAVLIEGRDPLVLAEIRAAFPKDFEEVSPLALRYLGKGTKAALGKRLERKGFFADELHGPDRSLKRD
jgi:hypothetical protein